MEIAKIEVGRTTGVCSMRQRIPARIAGSSVSVTFTDPVWDNLIKTVVFRGKETKIAEFDGAVAVIPQEVVAEPGVALYFGIFGHDQDSDLQIPLIEVRLGITEKSTDANADLATDPTLPIWAQLKQDVEMLKQDVEMLKQDVEDLKQGGGPGTPGVPGADGEDGGYYIPELSKPDEDTIQFAFRPSKADMPAVEPVTVELPVGQGSGGNVDLTGYATEQFVRDGYQPKGDYLGTSELPAAVNAALAQAKESGEFDGKTPVKGEDYYTEADKKEMVNAVLSALPNGEGVRY